MRKYEIVDSIYQTIYTPLHKSMDKTLDQKTRRSEELFSSEIGKIELYTLRFEAMRSNA